MQFFTAFFDRVFCVAVALLFSQLPQFALQYELRLSGALQECRHIVNEYTKAASQSGKTVDAYILKFERSGDCDFIAQGKIIKASRCRLRCLEEAYLAISGSSWLFKPFNLGYYGEKQLLLETAKQFVPGLSFTFETCFWVIFGAFIGFLTSRLCGAVVGHVRLRFLQLRL